MRDASGCGQLFTRWGAITGRGRAAPGGGYPAGRDLSGLGEHGSVGELPGVGPGPVVQGQQDQKEEPHTRRGQPGHVPGDRDLRGGRRGFLRGRGGDQRWPLQGEDRGHDAILSAWPCGWGWTGTSTGTARAPPRGGPPETRKQTTQPRAVSVAPQAQQLGGRGRSGRRGGRGAGRTTMARPPASGAAARGRRWTADQHPQHWSLTMTISRR